MLASSKPRVRKFHHKSRNGCIRCRERRVRCDVTKPRCQACTRLGFTCEWQQSPVGLMPIVMSSEELRSFQYYRENTMLDLRGHYDDGFWNGALLRMSHQHRFVEHFIVALSSLDEAYRLRTNLAQTDNALRKYSFSLEQYQQAIEGFRLSLAKGNGSELTLAACLICICIELWHGDHGAAGYHARAGAKLACSKNLPCDGTSALRNTSILTMLRAMILRACAQLGVDTEDLSSIVEAEETSPWPCIVESAATGLDDAHKHFYDLLESYASIADEIPVGHREQEALSLRLQLRKWYERLNFVTNEKVKIRREYHLLAIHYHAVCASLEALAMDDETRYDLCMSDFEALIEHSQYFVRDNMSCRGPIQSWRTLDGSVVMALLFVVMKCRDAQLRRSALRNLYRSRRLEGVFHSSCMAGLAEQLIALEEDCWSPGENVPQGIPAGVRRLRLVGFSYNPGILPRIHRNDIASQWAFDPPSMQYTYAFVSTPQIIERVDFKLRPHFSVGGFGMKSCFWYPMSRYPTIMDEEIPVETRHLEGPHLGLSPFSGKFNKDTWSQLYFRVLSISLPMDTTYESRVTEMRE